MEYSWRFGEVTKGFIWEENIPPERCRVKESDSRKRDGRGRAAVAAMLLAVVASYFTGEMLSLDETAVDGIGSSSALSEVVPVMSTGASPEAARSEQYGEVWRSERDARIAELATAYIEEYMSKNYGECQP